MQKTYWWRAGLVASCLVILFSAYAGPCEGSFGRCFGGNSIIVTRTFFHFSLSLILISPFLFFVSDYIFLRWLRFAAIWLVLAAICIILAPEYQGGWLGMGPEKESVSFWMSVLLVILSLIQLVWENLRMQTRNTTE